MFGKTFGRVAVAALTLTVAASATLAAYQVLNVRLATLAPDNSPWTVALRTMGAAWAKGTENRVRVTVFAGTIPSESSAIARMAVDGLQAATLTAGGLAEIDEAFNVFSLPFFFESDAELAHVQEKLTPMLSARLEAKKYQLINWGNGGWVQLFSKKPIRSLDDLKKAKLFTSEGSPKTVQWYTANGFNVTPLSASEIPKQLKLPTGAIDAAPSPPVFAVAMQFFRDAPYMLDVRVAPLTSATIMTTSAWNRISAADRQVVLSAAKEMEKQMQAQAPGLDAKSIDEMKRAGLNVITLDAKATTDFRATAEKLSATQRGNMIPADVFDLALRERDAFRRTKTGR